MKLSYLFCLPLFLIPVVSMPPRKMSPNDESNSREETPTQESNNRLSHAEIVAQAASGQFADSMGQYRFRSITETEQLLRSITIGNHRPSHGVTGVSRSSSGQYTLWVGRAELTKRKSAAHGIHDFEIGEDGRDTEEFDTIFAWPIEHYATQVAIEGLGSIGFFLKPRAFNNIMAHLEKIMDESEVEDDDDLGSIIKWRLNFGDRQQIARSVNELTEITKVISPRHVYDIIAYNEAQASAFSAERLARRAIRRRSIIDQIHTAEAKSTATNETTAEDIESVLSYFYALQAKATAALMPFIDALTSSNNFYLESLALPLYGMVSPSAFISSPFGPGPLASAGFDSFNDIQSALKASGNYSKSQLDDTASTHQYMRTAFRSIWKNATAVVNATGALVEMKNIIIYLAVTDMHNPNATDLFPESYGTVKIDANMASIMDRTNSSSIRRA